MKGITCALALATTLLITSCGEPQETRPKRGICRADPRPENGMVNGNPA